MARAARAIFVALCLLALAKIVLACDAAHYLNSIRAGDADAVSQCLASGLVVKPIRDEVRRTFQSQYASSWQPPLTACCLLALRLHACFSSEWIVRIAARGKARAQASGSADCQARARIATGTRRFAVHELKQAQLFPLIELLI